MHRHSRKCQGIPICIWEREDRVSGLNPIDRINVIIQEIIEARKFERESTEEV